MRKPFRTAVGALLAAALAGASCEDPQGFVQIQKHRDRVVDLFNYDMFGQAQFVKRSTVPADVVHPHFEGRWTYTDVEKPVDVYIIPAAYYDPNKIPTQQDSIFWTSNVEGQQRVTVVERHPTPGEWVIVLYNPLPFGPTSRARFACEIDLTYFK